MKLSHAILPLSIGLLLTSMASAVTRSYIPGQAPSPGVTAADGIMQGTGKVRSINLQTHRIYIDATEYVFDPLNTRFSNSAGIRLLPSRMKIGGEVRFSAKPATTSGSPPMLQAVQAMTKP